jgi:chemotaxis protein MotA
MDLATGLGLFFGFSVFIFLMMDGGGIMMFVSEHATIVIFGGAAAATMIRFPFSTILHGIPMAMKYAFSSKRFSQREIVDEVTRLAEVVRKSGPIALENETIEDEFLAKGMRMIADGYDKDFMRDTLERDRDNTLFRLDESQKVYRSIGDCAPAFGMIGTLVGMVQMFANMDDPSKLGPFMATALLATLYGAVVANLVCMPIADKVHLKADDFDVNSTLIIDGVLAIRDSKSPALVRELLMAYLPEHDRHLETAAA